ncbi:YggS family pyridoxal phosphate-dependent enzyme [bacterium]|nr:YggS family pyridoxal phosphate-dependent enzyme [bacterium]
MSIRENIRGILSGLPPGVNLEAAAKSRTPDEVLEAVDAGISIIGENYLQEAEPLAPLLAGRARLHFIGHLQTNKAKKAVALFDLIETVDSLRLAREIEKQASALGKTMPVLIEVNSGREPQKFGVLPEDLETLLQGMAGLPHVRVSGLMTMGPFSDDAETVRPYFRETRRCFESIRMKNIPGVDMTILSMGMSGSYRTAIEEGANLVRIGTLIFGERKTVR